MLEDMKDKWKKSLAVVKDLKELEFQLGKYEPDNANKVYSISHPDGKYSVWTANGFWFTSLYEINWKSVDNKQVRKFGFPGKILVWWHTLPHIKRLKKLKKEREVSVHKFW